MLDRFQALLSEIRACRICIEAPCRAPLPHEPRPVLRGTPRARIVVCGQAPGTRVHASGIPFTDPSGDRLRAWLGVSNDAFYDEDRFAIVPMGFCFPGLDKNGGDLPPRRECAAAWRQKVFSSLPHVEIVLAVGQYAQRWHLGKRVKGSLTETVRHWRALVAETDAGPRIWPLPHPSWRNNAWLAKNPWFEVELLPALREEIAAVLDQARKNRKNCLK